MAGRKPIPDTAKMKLRQHYFNDVEYAQLVKQAEDKGFSSVTEMIRQDYKLKK